MLQGCCAGAVLLLQYHSRLNDAYVYVTVSGQRMCGMQRCE
jgi:hypothetical protein